MHIAVVADGPGLDAVVSPAFEAGSWLIVVDTDNDAIVATMEKSDAEGLGFAQAAVDTDCEAVVCGVIEEKAFILLADACITRYDGAGLPARAAVQGAVDNTLPYLRDYEGGSGCEEHGHEEHDSCDGCGLPPS